MSLHSIYSPCLITLHKHLLRHMATRFSRTSPAIGWCFTSCLSVCLPMCCSFQSIFDPSAAKGMKGSSSSNSRNSGGRGGRSGGGGGGGGGRIVDMDRLQADHSESVLLCCAVLILRSSLSTWLRCVAVIKSAARMPGSLICKRRMHVCRLPDAWPRATACCSWYVHTQTRQVAADIR